MNIDRVEMRLVPLRLRERFEISSGGRQDRLLILVTLFDGDTVAWGECVAAEDPGYSYETTETAWHVLRDFLVPLVVGREFATPAEVADRLSGVRGHPMAQAAIEMAAWDLHARKRGVPLAEAIGGSVRPVEVGVSIGLQPDVDTLLDKVAGYVDAGYRRIKMKIKPGRDLEPLRAVRTAHPELPILADANSAYTLKDLELFREMDELNLMMIEQPLGWADLRDHARLQREIRTPVCLDESIRNPGDARLALELDAGRVVNIKPGRVGGFGNAVEIHDLCRAAGVPVWCGGMLESGIGRACNVALATLPGFTLPGDISASARYWEKDIVTPEWEMDDGTLRPLPAPGIGVEPDLDHIERITVRRDTLTA